MATFKENIKLAINLFEETGGNVSDEELFDTFLKYGMPDSEATEILIFMPAAFCRRLLPSINWLNYYYEYYENGTKTKKEYKDTTSYMTISYVVEEVFANRENLDLIKQIAFRSSEFDALNKFLKDGGKLENVEILPTTIYR